MPEEIVRVVALCEDLSKRNEQIAKERDRLRRDCSRDRAKNRTSLLPREQRSLLRILGVIITSPPYEFDHKRPKNAATKKIWNLTVLKNVEVDEDTVLKWAREAANEIAGSRE